MGLKGDYKDVSVNLEKLKKFLKSNFNTKFFNFGHITVKHNQHQLLKTSVNGAKWVLKVDEIKILDFN